MKLLYACAAFALSVAAADDTKTKPPPPKPCTIHSASTGGFFDLNALYVEPLKKDAKPSKKPARTESWQTRGYDYGANFTMNFCGPVVEQLDHVEGLDKSEWKNVSAYYTKDKKTYSIGQLNTELVIRGHKLVLNFTGGSPCDTSHSKRGLMSDLAVREPRDDDGDNDDQHKISARKDSTRRKSTIVILSCDQEPLAPRGPKVTLSFAGALDECAYFFEARSAEACAGIETTPSQLGPSGVFGVIMLIAILVYLVGGCVYQRTVMHQRGWKQLPNYSMWAGIFGFFVDMVIILTSSCARFLPGRRGYSRVSLNGNGNSRGRGIHSDESENRLIDQLDEEWED